MFLLGAPLLGAGIEAEFPVSEEPPVPAVLANWPQRGTSKPYYKEGKLIYFSVMGGVDVAGHSIENSTFDKVREGMTLDAVISLLGPGTLDSLMGVASVCWKSEDGRGLLLTDIGSIHEKAEFIIREQRHNRRHAEVRAFAEKLIASMETDGGTVRVALTEDTGQAKAMEVKTYRVNDTFQKAEPLPRIDFTITRIEGGDVHCHYFYQPAPEGVHHYSEYGNVVLRGAGD